MDEEFLMTISPYVRRIRIMQTKALSGMWMDYDHCVTGIMEGEADFIIEGTRYHLVKGDIIIIPPLCRHRIEYASEMVLTQYIFHFDFFYYKSRNENSQMLSIEAITQKNSIPDKENIMNGTPLVVHLAAQELLEFQTCFLQLLNEYKSNDFLSNINMKSLCIKILVIILRSRKTTYISASKNASRMRINTQRAIEYIHRNYDNPELNNERIAIETGVSSKYLSQIFRREMGIQVHRYLNSVRIEAAKKLAVLGTMNITEIAYAVGYRSIHSFSKIFKKTTGITPSEFLRANITDAEEIYIKSDKINLADK